MPTETRPKDDLLALGAKSYLNALTAIEAFDSEVEAICRGVYHRHEARLLDQMGLDPADLDRHTLPSPEDREAEIGVCRSAQKGGPLFYIYLWWREDKSGAPEISGAVALDLSTKKVRDDIYERLRRQSPGCRVTRDVGDRYFLVLATPIRESELAEIPEILDRLVSEWLGYCESVGGLKLKKIK